MTKKDYKEFIYKVDQLNKLIKFINQSPEKFQKFVNCKTHQEVVELAKEWGYEIGKRWGEY